MSLYNGPARGGNRGGKDQFNWESVKSDKDREFYLGHSVKATTGRWQKGVFSFVRKLLTCPLCPQMFGRGSLWFTQAGPFALYGAQPTEKQQHSTKTKDQTLNAAGKDVFWYTREKQEEEAAKARLEMQAIKQREEDLMNEVGEQLLSANECVGDTCHELPVTL